MQHYNMTTEAVAADFIPWLIAFFLSPGGMYAGGVVAAMLLAAWAMED